MKSIQIDKERAVKRTRLWQPLLDYALKNSYKRVENTVNMAVGDELPGLSGIENEVSNYAGFPDFLRLEAQALREEAEERLQKIVGTMYDERIASLKNKREDNAKSLRQYEDKEGECEFSYFLGQEVMDKERGLTEFVDDKVLQVYNILGSNIEEIDRRIAAFEKIKQRTLEMLKTEGETAEQYRKNLDLASKYELLACAIVKFEREQDKPKLSFGPF